MLFGVGWNSHQKNVPQFFQSVQIYMKDAECAESKEKSGFRFFQFLFFRAMVIFVTSSFITPIFD